MCLAVWQQVLKCFHQAIRIFGGNISHYFDSIITGYNSYFVLFDTWNLVFCWVEFLYKVVRMLVAAYIDTYLANAFVFTMITTVISSYILIFHSLHI